jgi:nicotinate dehydrogenase subunit B
MNIQISRRDALKGSGALIVGFALAGPLSQALAQSLAKPLALTEVDSFLAIDKAGNVTVYSGKVDLGTGVSTALRQIVADELDVAMDKVNLVQGDTLLTPDPGKTWASVTIQVGGMQLRQAAATARKALVEEAAKKLGTDQLTVADGVVSGGGKKVSYAALISGKSFALKLDPKAPAKEKDPKDYKLVGKPLARLDIPAKCTGTFTYMQDFRVPGMLHARVVRPPAIGAKLESVDENSLKGIAGIVKLVCEGNFLAVVTSNEWDAIRGATALRATWSKSETLPDQAKLGSTCAPSRSPKRRSPATSVIPPRPWPRKVPRPSRRLTISPSRPTARSGRPAPSPSSRMAS